MDEQKQEIINRMKELQTLIPNTVKALDCLPDGMDLYANLDPGELRAIVDYNPQKYLELRRGIAKCWKFKKKHFNRYNGHYYVYLQHRIFCVKLSLELVFPTEYQDGVSCRLVESGHKTSIIYELECK